jgi:hypothetical protein
MAYAPRTYVPGTSVPAPTGVAGSIIQVPSLSTLVRTGTGTVGGFDPGTLYGGGGTSPGVVPGLPALPGTSTGTPQAGTASPIVDYAGLGAAGCALLPAGTARDLCMSIVGAVTSGSSGTTGANSAGAQTGAGFAASSPCPQGYVKNAQTGVCELSGLAGTVQRVLPGGQTGTMSDVSGQVVIGAFGIPAMYPTQVGSITRGDGTVSPILRCHSRMKLGADDLCYMKGTRGVMWKYHRQKPVISRKDYKALSAIGRVQRVAEKLAKDAGLHVYKTARTNKRKR